MAPKRATKANPAATTSVTNAQLKAMIDQGVTDALVPCDADRNTNGDDSHNSRTGVRRTERVARECTYPDFMKCQPLNFKGTEGVVELIQWFEKMETLGEIKKLETELWNLKVKGTDVIGYNQRFQELVEFEAERMFPEESDKIERYVSGLPDMIHESVVASRPKTIEQKKEDDNQQQNERQNTVRADTSGSGEKKPYGGSKPLCSKCNYHHNGPCAPKCYKCNRVGHLAYDCRSPANTNTSNNQRGTGAGQKPTCYECGA
ncbi:reverse transcriptase domain-containing protein [Tanacetum coccineum]